MVKILRSTLVLAGLLLAVPALAQNLPTSSGTRVQGTPDGYGAPVQVTIVGADGADVASTPVSGTVTANAGTGTFTVGGTAASGASKAGAPVRIGCTLTSTLPTVTDGQTVDAQCTARGSLITTLGGAVTTGGDGFANTSLLFGKSATQADALPVVGLYAYTGSSWGPFRADINGTLVQSAQVATRWRYTSGASPILSNTTTAVTIKTAAGGVLRNVVDACQFTTTAFGASVPLAIRDGAAGTIMFALTVPTAGFLQPVIIRFDPPLTGTANTLTEIVTTTANTTGTVTANCQGHTET